MLFEIISGRRINSKLLYSVGEEQLYAKKSTYKDITFYVCYEKKCRSRVFLKDNTLSKYADFIQHNHGSQKQLYEEFKALHEIKSECLNLNCLGENTAITGIRETFKRVSNRSQEATKNLDFSKLKRGLQYLSSTVYKTSPKTPAEVQEAFEKEAVFKNFGMTRHDGGNATPFFKVCHNEKDFSYCLFASDKCGNLIKENIPDSERRKILVDGTFAVVPMGCFKQLIIIAIEYLEKLIPFAFVLMDKKCSKAYTHLFSFINSDVLPLTGATFIMDYEHGLRKAISTVFAGAKIFGCWFHYCQAIRRQITMKNKDLAKFVRDDKKASLSYHKILSLPLLPPSHIRSSFDAIKNDVQKFDHHYKFISFFHYFENQWLNKIGPEGMSVSETTTRTTSSLEAYNGVLGKLIPKNGNFFKFIQVLQGEELTRSREFEKFCESGGSFGKVKRRKKGIEKHSKILKSLDELEKGSITAPTFLNRMVYPSNKTCINMEPDEDLFEDIVYLEEEEEDAEEEETPQELRNVDAKLCVVCVSEEPNILLLPCKHLKICSACLLKLQANSIASDETLICPVCRQQVDDTMQVFL